MALRIITFGHKSLNIRVFLANRNQRGISISFVETCMTNGQRGMPMLKSMCNKRRSTTKIYVIFKEDNTMPDSPMSSLITSKNVSVEVEL